MKNVVTSFAARRLETFSMVSLFLLAQFAKFFRSNQVYFKTLVKTHCDLG